MHIHVIFSGRVQGVGFRYTARALAIKHAVTGTVKNLANGSVELYGCGIKEAIEAFLEAIQDDFSAYITHVDCTELDQDKTYLDFLIV